MWRRKFKRNWTFNCPRYFHLEKRKYIKHVKNHSHTHRHILMHFFRGKYNTLWNKTSSLWNAQLFISPKIKGFYNSNDVVCVYVSTLRAVQTTQTLEWWENNDLERLWKKRVGRVDWFASSLFYWRDWSKLQINSIIIFNYLYGFIKVFYLPTDAQ